MEQNGLFINLTPFFPLSLVRRGEIISKRGTPSLLNTLLADQEEKEEIFKRSFLPLFDSP